MTPFSKVKTLLAFVSICVCNAQCKLEIPIVLHGTWSVGLLIRSHLHPWLTSLNWKYRKINKWYTNKIAVNSPEKWLYNKIYCPSNRSKQIKETHTAYGAGTQYTRQSLNEKQHTWLHRQTVIDCEAMYAVLHSNFAAFIVRQRYKPCGFPGFVWTDCWGNKSCYVITSPANCCQINCQADEISTRLIPS